MELLKGQVLVRITAAVKQRVFQDSATYLFKAIPQEPGMGKLFEQSVQSAEVIMVAHDVQHIQPGDIAILDYIADTLEDRVICKDDRGKVVCLDSRTEYHDEDRISYASLTTRQDVYAWRKGDVDQASLIYGVFRADPDFDGGRLIPNPPYIICEHKNFQLSSKESGLCYLPEETGAVIRRVLVPNGETDEELLPGSYVVVEQYCLYEREMDDKTFDVIMNQDIEMSFE